MDPKIIQTISKQVYKRFPEVAGKKPKVRKRPLPKSTSKPIAKTYLFTFRGNANGPGGKIIPRRVRVVVNENGKILKMTTSKG